MDPYYSAPSLPNSFIWRRLQSLMGFFLVLFLIQHLLTNSQAALMFGQDGRGFIRAVNAIQDLPFLKVIEILLIAFPFLVHGIWGVVYLRSAKMNSMKMGDANPYFPYARNLAFSWQRITSYILVVGIAAHVVHMRFVKYPEEAQVEGQQYYTVQLDQDPDLASFAARHDVSLTVSKQGQVVAVAKDFGTAELLLVRETFKMPVMIFFYTILVLAACYHGFNGLWTFMIKWGVTLTSASQMYMRYLAYGLMLIVTFLGFAAVWGTYWINFKF